MGTEFLEFYTNKFTKKYRVAFYTTFIIGLLAYVYKLTNTLLNHDSVYAYYDTNNLTMSGRWFLGIASMFSTFFDLPWINGIIALFFVSFTSIIIVKLLDVNNTFVIALIGGILVTFPAISETMMYGFTVDGFMIAMFFSAIYVYFSRITEHRISRAILSSVFLCLCCAIYQAYLSFALLLMMIYFIYILAEKEFSNKQYRSFIIRQIIIIVVAMIVYYLMWKICLLVFHEEITSYQSINEVGVNLDVIFSGFSKMISDFKKFFFGMNSGVNPTVSLYDIISVFIIIAIIAAFIIYPIITNIYKSRGKLITYIVIVLLLPEVVFMWQFTASSVDYHLRMEQSISLLFIFTVIVFDKLSGYTNNVLKKLPNIIAMIFVAFIINSILISNIGFYLLDQTYKLSYARGLEMMSRIDKCIDSEESIESIAILGTDWEAVKYYKTHNKFYNGDYCINNLERNLLFDGPHTYNFLTNTFDLNLDCSSEQQLKTIVNSKEFKEMPIWNSDKSVKVINNVLVIKLSNKDFVPKTY